MKKLKRKISLLLALCMVLTCITPAYADVETVSEAAAFDTVILEEDENVGIVEEVSPAEAEYDFATPSDAEYAETEEPEELLPEEIIPEKATPSNAKREGEILIREITVNGIKITLTADPGVFPDGAELWAERVEDEAAEEAIEEAVEKERGSSVNVAKSYKFDIKMLLLGEEIQPDTTKGSVKVTFTLEEKLNDCLTANAYHLKEEADGELTAENLEAEVKTVEAGVTESSEEAALLEEDEILSDGIIEDDAALNAEVTEIEAEITGFSYYVVEFTYNELQYVLPGDSSVKLSEILKTLAIEGTVSEAEVSNEDLFTVIKDTEGDDWTVTALQAFSSKEWMKVTIDGQVYEIIVTDENETLLVELLYNGKRMVVNGNTASLYDILSALGIYYEKYVNHSAEVVHESPECFEIFISESKMLEKSTITFLKRFSGEATLKITYKTSNVPETHEITMRCLQKETVEYIDEKGEPKTAECIVLTGTKDYRFESDGWYVAKGDLTMLQRIENNAPKSAPAHLILADGGHLTAKGGIHTKDDCGLKIYAQSEETGKLTVTEVPEKCAGIGGDFVIGESCGSIVISGGVISIEGGKNAAGIGSGADTEGTASSGSVIINGGTLTVHGGIGGSSIGRGTDSFGLEQIIINGGELELHGYIGGVTDHQKPIQTKIVINGGRLTVDGAIVTNGEFTVSDKLLFYAIDESGALVEMSAADYQSKPTGYVVIGSEKGEYKVHYLLQKADLSGYEEAPGSPVTCSGPVGTMTVAGKRYFEGFRCETVTEQLITGESGIELEAKYNRVTFNIKYYLNGRGSGKPPLESHVYEEKLTEPSAPSAEGYTFAGWYEEPRCINKFAFTTMPGRNVSLYARWVINNYTITWKDGNTVLRTDKVDYDTMPDYGPDPSKTGYEFLMWWPEVKKVTGDATYNAIFFKPTVKCTVTWMLNDIKLIDTTEVTEGEMPVHENPEREGYIFIGWKPALAPVTGNVKYTAYFEERGTDKVAVTFNTDGGTFINTQVIDRNTTPVKPSDPQKKGYKFGGWYREAGFITPYNFDEPVNTDMILYAKWTELPVTVYTVTWKLDDGMLIDTTEVKEGDMPSHSSPSKTGYIFVGWEPTLAPVTSNITYTARFEQRTPEKAAVTFNTSGGSFIETQVVTKGQKAVRPADPVKTGYSFVNWYADAAFTTMYDFDTAVMADVTLFAKWQKNAGKEYTITWKDWNGNVLASQKVSEGGLPKYPGAVKPSRSGYIFTGWTPEIDLAYADRTYTATYEPKSSGGGGGGGGGATAAKKTAVTFSPNWYADIYGVWRIKNSAGQVVTNAWLCDDVVTANGQNVWYLLGADGAMIAAGLVQDATGNFYSLETNHDGYFGMLRYQNGTYNCNGQQVYLTFNHEHNGSFGAITNAEGLEKLKAIYGVTKYGIGNENSVYTATF